MKKTFLFVVAAILAANCASAGESKNASRPAKHPKVEAVTAATPMPSGAQSVITGTVICSSGDLKKTKEAKTKCDVDGRVFWIKTKNVRNPKGELLSAYVGKTYQILANDKSAALLKKEYKDRDVIIVGKIYSDKNIVEIDFVKLAPVK